MIRQNIDVIPLNGSSVTQQLQTHGGRGLIWLAHWNWYWYFIGSNLCLCFISLIDRLLWRLFNQRKTKRGGKSDCESSVSRSHDDATSELWRRCYKVTTFLSLRKETGGTTQAPYWLLIIVFLGSNNKHSFDAKSIWRVKSDDVKLETYVQRSVSVLQRKTQTSVLFFSSVQTFKLELLLWCVAVETGVVTRKETQTKDNVLVLRRRWTWIRLLIFQHWSRKHPAISHR